MALQHSSLAVCKFRTASEKRCRLGYNRCVQTLLPDVVAHVTHLSSLVSSNCELSSHDAGNLHGGWLHGRPHKPQNCQNWGVGPCSGMGACTGQYGNSEKIDPRADKKQEVNFVRPFYVLHNHSEHVYHLFVLQQKHMMMSFFIVEGGGRTCKFLFWPW